VTEYLTGEQLIDRLRTRTCDDCGAEITDDVTSLYVLLEQGARRFTIECPFCGALESFEVVADQN
jgi:hypothetical protein